jgi:uncharacterized protein
LLRDKGFLVPVGVDELDLVRLRFLSGRHSPDSLGIYLGLTLGCNLRCSYCFEGHAQSLPARKAMDRRTQDAVIRHIATQARGKKSVQITWFGGEPLLGLRTITRMSELLLPAFDKAGIQYSGAILTNGVLANRAAADALKAARVGHAQVTVDVPKSQKRNRQGRDTLPQALDGAACLAAVMNVNLRVNVCRDDAAEFDALYEALLHRRLQKRLRSIEFANVLKPECGGGCVTTGLLRSGAYVQVLQRERAKAGALGFSSPPLSLRPASACMATAISGVTIGPDGLLYKCCEDMGLTDRAFGSVFHPDIKLSNFLPWLTYDWFRHKQCRNCPVLPQCAGGCPHKRLYQAHALKRDGFCFWFMRGDLENRIREYAMNARPDRVAAKNG